MEEIVIQKQNFKIDIRSILGSNKDGLTERELINQYKDLTGRMIPFMSLGYQSIYDLMRDMPDAVQIRRHRNGNTWIYYAVHDEVTKGLGNLVQHQLDPKKGVREQKRATENSYRYNNGYGNNGYRGSSQRSVSCYGSRNFQSSSNQFTPRPRPPLKVPNNLQKNIEIVLKNSENNWVKVDEFLNKFENKYGVNLDYGRYDFATLMEFFESIDHLVKIEPFDKSLDHQALKNNEDYTRKCYIHLITQIDHQTHNNHPSQINHINKQKDNNFNGKGDNGSTENKIESDQPRNNLTLEESMVLNVKNLIDLRGEAGLDTSSIPRVYKDYYNKNLDFQKLGFDTVDDFLLSKIDVPYVFVMDSKTNCLRVMKKNTNIQNTGDQANHAQASINPTEIDEENEVNKDRNASIEYLRKSVYTAIKNYINVPISIQKFFDLFEETHGWKLDEREYGFITIDQLLCELVEKNIISFHDEDDDSDMKILVTTEMVGKLNDDQKNDKSKISSSNNLVNEIKINKNMNTISNGLKNMDLEDEYEGEEEQKLAKIRYAAEFIQDYVLYSDDLKEYEILKQVALKDTHNIIISNVVDPTNFQFQISENVPILDQLMDELEKVYCGIGASAYDMPREYISHGRLCASIFPGDNNWHRCRIIGINEEANTARIFFLDYGGDAEVPMSQIKFLARQLGNLPIQAVNAKFANIKKPARGWKKNVIVYLLNKVMGKSLEAKILGFNESHVSVEIFDKTTSTSNNGCPHGTQINLNKRIIMDGYGDGYDEREDDEFIDFENWRVQIVDNNINNNINERKIIDSSNESNKRSSTYSTDREAIELKQKKSDALLSGQSHSIRGEKLKVRTKSLNVVIPYRNDEAKLNLISIQDQIFVHWFQVCNLMSLNEIFFQSLMKSNFLLKERLVKVFNYNEQTEELFDFIKKGLKIDIELLNETESISLIYFNKLSFLFSYVFEPCLSDQYHQSIKGRNNRSKSAHPSTNMVNNNNYNSTISLNKSETCSVVNDKQRKRESLNEQIYLLEKECQLVKSRMLNEKSVVNMEWLSNECRNLEEKIERYKFILSELN